MTMDYDDPPQYAEALPDILRAAHIREESDSERLIVGLVNGPPVLKLHH